MTSTNYTPLDLMYFKIIMPWPGNAAALSLLVNTNTVLLRKNMIELLNFIGRLNLGTFILIWTSTIFFVIFISLLLISVSQINKETIIISKKVKILIEALSEKTSTLGDNDS